jgi:hypothetical protein
MHFNTSPMHYMLSELIERNIGFTSTHPKAVVWQQAYEKGIREYLGDDVFTLLDALLDYQCGIDDAIDFRPACFAIDRLSVQQGKRPPGWVPTGENRAVREFGNMHALVTLWSQAEVAAAAADDEGPSLADIQQIEAMLRDYLPGAGDATRPWCLMVEPEEDVPAEGFKPSLMVPEVCTKEPGYVQWSCCQGRATAWQGTYEQKPY